ncbi:cytochrome c oxidase subunit 6a, mitochondrial-like [Canna indica]|uniref:Cytochrome c oxidase subunit 6a, mitochondrial-like n=1 Tax=Canna indica TaxID=4628 RepID=A0AAQ3KAY3_9LILI|nr:cytochrome c oxidase subunit 6a, mitochondrial-like [Canna indica]
MATPLARSCLRSNLARRSSGARPGTWRSFSTASAARYDESHEAEKWEKITIAGIITCVLLSIYNLRKGHHEYPEPPPCPYLHIKNKEFPWGPEPLFEHIKKKKQLSKH